MTEFESWLERNQDKFMRYTYKEVARLALSCGFSREEVNQWLEAKKGVV